MAASFTSTPTGLQVQGQPIVYTCQTSITPASDFRIVITVDEKNSVGTYVLKGKYYLTLNAFSRVHFDLNDVIHNLLSLDYQNNSGGDIHTSAFGGTDTGTPATSSNRSFRVGCGEFNSGTETLRDATIATTLINGYVPRTDGFNVNQYPEYNTSTLAQKNKFWMVPQEASNALSPRTIIKADPEDLGVVGHVMNPTGVTADQPYNFFWAVYIDATTVTAGTIGNPSLYGYPLGTSDRLLAGGTMSHTACYPKRLLDASSYTGAWTSIDVFWQNSVNLQLTGLLTFENVCTRSRGYTTRVAFANSVGGWSYYNFSGRTHRSLSRRQKVVNKVVGTYGEQTFSVPANAPDMEVFGLEVEESYDLNAIVEYSDMLLLEELFKSKQHSMQLGASATFIPVILDTSTIGIRDEPMSQVYEVSLTVKLAQRVRC